MHKLDLNRAFGPTPPRFSQAMKSTLADLPAGRKKGLPRRSALVAAAVILALTGMVYAAIQLGQDWYYPAERDLYQQQFPDKYQAIMDHLVTQVPQTLSGPASALAHLKVQDYAWASEQGIATISFLGQVVGGDKAELYSLWEVDLDGAQVGRIDPTDPDSRLEHYIKTPKGFGLPREVMADPSKQLLLLDLGQPLYIGDSQHILAHTWGHTFTTDQGPVMQVMEIDLNALSEETRAAIKAHSDENGNLLLRCPYAVVPFADNAFLEPVPGELVFTIHITK